jgi:hypothetical protein
MSRKRYRREETCAGLWQAKVQVGDGKPLFYCLTACWYPWVDDLGTSPWPSAQEIQELLVTLSA